MNTGRLGELFGLDGKVALVTGSSSGIGQSVAIELARAGAAVMVHGRDAERTAAVRAEIEAAGGRAATHVCDLAEVDAARELVESTVAELGALDILINNAGLNRRKPAIEVTEDDYDVVTGVDIKSVFFLCQAAHPHLARARAGRVVNIASLNVRFALDTVSIYGLSKGAMVQLTKALAVEWAPDGILVNAISPGLVATPLTAPLRGDAEKVRWFNARIPLRRASEPEEIAGCVLFLTSAASSYVTGIELMADGGFTAGGSWIRDDAEAAAAGG